ASPTPGTTLTGSVVTFTWNPVSGATYLLYVGTTGVGSSDLLYGNEGANTSQAVSGIPTDGRQIYVRLYTYVTAYQFIDYTYAACTCGGPPALTISKSHANSFTQGQTGALY